ncbi:porin [Burkholderia ambifaria]|uniref:porin n=1 Tax=Burkholderia ambifaria TaxID=152480 RepID=UPI001BA277AA|nr:porin [Burkholderia ambifaria]MBR8175787.1 porin [Burkholderia ambifaria]
MRNTEIALSCAFMMSTIAHAESSIALYGTVDNGFNFTSNAGGHNGYGMVSADAAPSMWGFKGTEDLGGGMSAIMQLEDGFDINSGKSLYGGLFGRQAFMGLSSTRAGTLTIGRQYDAMVDAWSIFTAAGSTMGDLAAHIFDNDNADYSYRYNNAVKYVSPSFLGLQAEAAYAFSNATGFANNRAYSGSVSYANGPVSAAVAYSHQTNGGTTLSGAVSSDLAFVAAAQSNVGVGVKYTFSNASNVSLAYSHVSFDSPTGGIYITDVGSAAWTSWKFDNVELNGQYFFAPDVWLAASYTFTHARLQRAADGFSPNWHQAALMLDYDLSKRTSVYLQGAFQHNNARTGTGFDNAYIVGSMAPSTTGNQTVVRLGLIHRF